MIPATSSSFGHLEKSALGIYRLIEEYGAHMDELAVEVALRGVNSTRGSALRQAFQQGGRRGVIDYLFKIPKYRQDFGASSWEEIIRQQGPGFSFGL